MSGTAGLIGVVSVLGGLVLVCALAFAMLKLVQKMPGGMGSSGSGSPVRFLRSLPVGQRERVTLVAYRGEVFMLGVSAGSVTLLARMDEEEAEASSDAPAVQPWLAERFKSAMAAARSQKAEPSSKALDEEAQTAP